ncbi:leucine-rich repeat protein, partial [Lutispora sp.]|uniref:leucine-rich repeat protein n=1 Tax=Lutispora sp. TaxID=2828727 RepID=UPI002B2106BE
MIKMKCFKKLVSFILIFAMAFTNLGFGFIDTTSVYAQDTAAEESIILENKQDVGAEEPDNYGLKTYAEELPILSLDKDRIKAGETVTAAVYSPDNPNKCFDLTLWDLSKNNYYETTENEVVQTKGETDDQGRDTLDLTIPSEAAAGNYQIELKFENSTDKFYTDLIIDEISLSRGTEHITLSIDKMTIGKGYVLEPTRVEFTDGEAVWDVLKREMDNREIKYKHKSYEQYGSVYIQSIAGDGEFDHGSGSGWMYNVNGWYPDHGVSLYKLNDGDVVAFRYTCDLGADIGADFNNPDKALKSISADQGILNPIFAAETEDYILTLPAGTREIMITPAAANALNKVTIETNDRIYRPIDKIPVAEDQVITITCADNIHRITIAFCSSDQEFANIVIAQIEALPELNDITLEHKARIEAVKQSYNKLAGKQKELVTNYSKLEAAASKIIQIEEDNQAKASNVIGLIKALPAPEQLTLAHRTQVEAARSVYNNLTQEQKKIVGELNLAILTAAEEKIAELLNPTGAIAKNYFYDFLLNSLDFEIEIGKEKEIIMLDVPRAGLDDYQFNRDDLIIETIKGKDIIKIEKFQKDFEEHYRYNIAGLKAGVAEIEVSYPDFKGQKPIVVVNVIDSKADGPELNTDIKCSKYDILYFTGDSYDLSFNVDTESDAVVSASVNGKNYEADERRFNIKLRDGYNPIVITAKNTKGTTVKTYNLRAKKLAYTIENSTRPNLQDFYVGDVIKISFTGLVTPVPKISRVYNPAHTYAIYNCNMPRYTRVMGGGSQYDIATGNEIELELTGAGKWMLSGGHIFESWFGDPLYSEDVSVRPPNLDAKQPEDRFSALPDIHLTVKDNPNYKPQGIFTTRVENKEVITPGDEVHISIPDLNIAAIAKAHPKSSGEWMTDEIIQCFTIFTTNIPGLKTVKSAEIKQLEDLERLKTIKFIVPIDTQPGTYMLKGGYVWVKYGPDWWTKEKDYFVTKIPDTPIEIKDRSYGIVEIGNIKLRNRLLQALGKAGGDLTKHELASITGEIDLSGLDIDDSDMSVMKYLKGVSAINLSNNPAITSSVVNKEAFDWTSLNSIDFSGCTGIAKIEKGAFQGAKALKAITLSDTVKSIEAESFKDCADFGGLILPDSIEALGDNAFSGCKKLLYLKFPNNLQNVGRYLFYNSGLTLLNLKDTAFTKSNTSRWSLPETAVVLYAGQDPNLSLKSATIKLGQDNLTLTHAIPGAETVIWGSHDITVAAVENGIVTAVQPGVAYIYVKTEDDSHSDVCIVTVKDTAGARLKELSFSNIALKESFEPSRYIYHAEILGDTRTTTLTAHAEEEGAKIEINGGEAVEGTSSKPIALLPGANIIVIKVTSSDGKTIKNYKIGVDMKAVGIGDNYIVIANPLLQERLAVAAGKESGYIGKLTFKELESIKGTIDLSNAVINDKDMEVMKYLKGVSGIDLSGNTAITSESVKKETFDWTKPKSFDFKDCTSITEIAYNAFKGAANLIQISLPETVETILGSAFNGCEKLTAISMPGVTKINGQAFKGCSSLKETGITIYDGVEKLDISGDDVFSGTGFKELPKFISKVKVLPNGIFRDCLYLETAIIPESITQIKKDCFWNCRSLKNVEIPSSMAEIGDSCFNGCSSLEYINIPINVIKLGSYFFSNCNNLKHVVIQSNVKELGYNFFSGSPSLAFLDLRKTSITSLISEWGYPYNWGIPASAVVLLSGEKDAELSVSETTIILGDKSLKLTHKIPEGKAVFWGSTNTDVAVVSDGVVTGKGLGNATIYIKAEDGSYSGTCYVKTVDTDIAKLKALSLSDISLKEAFSPSRYFYTADTGVHTASTKVTAQAADEGAAIKINNEAATGGSPSGAIPLSLGTNTIEVKVTTAETTKTYTIAITVKDIFEDGDKVVIANHKLLEKLASAAGKGSGYKGKLSMGELASIAGSLDLSDANIINGDMAVMKYLKGASAINLSDNTAITSVTAKKETFDWTTPKNLNFSGCTGITEMAKDAFRECTSLTGITLPKAVISLGDEFFAGCTSLKEAELPGLTDDGLGKSLFKNCTSITDVGDIKLPETVTYLPEKFFEGCIGITHVELPKHITRLGDGVFYKCTGITKTDISGIKIFDNGNWGLLNGCTSLKKVIWPEGITLVPQSFFAGCTGITEMELPDTLESLGRYVFGNCNGIKDLRDIKMPESITHLPNECFAGCDGLTKIELPGHIKSLGKNVFRDCTNITEADISGVEAELEFGLLSNCTSLKKVILPQGITKLPDLLFRGCAELSCVEIPDSVTGIGNQSFGWTKKLYYLAIPGSVTKIANNCFLGAEGLNILDLRATSFTKADGKWKVPADSFILLPGADAKLTAEKNEIQAGENLAIAHSIPLDKEIKWHSSNPMVAGVENGVVTGSMKGIAFIAAKADDDSYSGIYKVTVVSGNEDPKDHEAANKVIDKITALPAADKLTLEDKGLVEAARKAYNALTEEQKTLIINLDKLVAAERRIAQLEEENIDKVPPVITATVKNETVNTGLYKFTAGATDDKDGSVDVVVKHNDKKVEAKDQYYEITLRPGVNKIEIFAWDKAGNEAKQTYTINYEIQQTYAVTFETTPKEARVIVKDK